MPLGWLNPAITVCDVLSAVLRVALALFSLSLYEKHAKGRIERVCTQVADGPQRAEALARSGGTSMLAAGLFFGGLMMLGGARRSGLCYMAGPAFLNALMMGF